jgi:hypothetical protein
LQVLHAEGSLLAYQRGDLLVCLNLANHLEVLTLPGLTSGAQILLEANGSVTLEPDVSGGMQVNLPALGGAVIKANPNG